jgi:hypothetical protein
MIQGHAQPVAQFDAKDKNIGMLLWKQPVTVYYQMTNTGNQPLIIERVVPSCACSEAEWTKEPIAPQKMGEISVVYDAKTLGHFYKDVAVYTNASEKPVYLAFRGEVATEVFEDANNYPYQIGSLRLSHSSIEFDDVNMGEKPTFEIKVMNGTGEMYEPALMHLPPYLSAEITPEKVGKNMVGTMIVTLDSEKLPKLGLTTASVYLSRFPGDVVGAENEIPVSVINLPDFSHRSSSERQNPPKIQLAEDELYVDGIRETEIRKLSVEIRNVGRSNLKILDLQVLNGGLGADLKKRELAPGKKTKMKITVEGSHLKDLKSVPRILLITNDPENPKVMIKVNTTLTK